MNSQGEIVRGKIVRGTGTWGMIVRGTGTWGMQDKFKFYQKNLEV